MAVEKRILSERAVAIEKAVHKSLNYSTGNDYRASERPYTARRLS